ncbi:MAG: patatin-like phospholipase family protein [Planctomycetota bacterium]
MKKFLVASLAALGALVLAGWVYVGAVRAQRPPTPPPGSPIQYPWGSMHVDEDQDEVDSELEETIIDSFEAESEDEFDEDDDGVREYSILVLSGGGAAGAYGAGFLTGWTASGERPEFKIVTGVSTGSLQSTFAFLGSDYDDELTEVFTQYATEDIYTKRSLLGALLTESAWDTAPLEALIERYITAEVLDAVAAEYAKGHCLFVGTANIDTGEFIVWDMGEIASSDRDDRLERYRKVLLASCSIPVLFPPVYFSTEIDGEKYYEMHVDGGAQSQLFLRGFMLDFEETLLQTGLLASCDISLYIIRNGHANEAVHREIVSASALSIASATINGVFDLSTESSLFRVYMLAARYGIDFNLAVIPDDLFLDLDPVEFDLDVMGRVYEYGYEQARGGYDWAKIPPDLAPYERVEPLASLDAAGSKEK